MSALHEFAVKVQPGQRWPSTMTKRRSRQRWPLKRRNGGQANSGHRIRRNDSQANGGHWLTQRGAVLRGEDPGVLHFQLLTSAFLVLEPDFHMGVGETQHSSNMLSFFWRDILLDCDSVLQGP